jgi:enoyl-CoA hydratase/carnithine racemase
MSERSEHIFAIGIDRPAKLNGFSPRMMRELAGAMTAFEHDADARDGVLWARGPYFTAGLELDKMAPFLRERGSLLPEGSVDPSRCGRRCEANRLCAPCRASASRSASN